LRAFSRLARWRCRRENDESRGAALASRRATSASWQYREIERKP
jgi:hypothetical protein